MILREEITCPLELAHDMIKGKWKPINSIPIKIEEAPQNTVSYCIFIEDKDSIPVCGFSLIHWVVANLTKNEIKDNESINAKDFLQGVNSWYGPVYGFEKEKAIGYATIRNFSAIKNFIEKSVTFLP